VKSGHSAERAGWLLVHDDDTRSLDRRRIVGHLRPSLTLARGASVPVFLAHPALIAVPALTPSSPGLNVLSSDCARALHALGMPAESFEVIAATADRVYSVGSLAGLRGTLQTRPPGAPVLTPSDRDNRGRDSRPRSTRRRRSFRS
jgi:metallophosphoesterase superfamily enzyme